MTELNTDQCKTFIEQKLNENYIYFENYKIVKLIEPAYIYQSHIRNSNNDIYSITVESVNHTKDYIYSILSN